MTPEEMGRFLLGLRSAGWSEKKINDFLLYIGSGDEAYEPKRDEEDGR